MKTALQVIANENSWVPIHRYFEEMVTKFPSYEAIIWENELSEKCSKSYAELNYAANQLADFLDSFNFSQGTRIAVCLPRSYEYIVSLLGVLKAKQLIFVCLNVDFDEKNKVPQEKHFLACLKDSEPSLIITLEQTEALIKENIPELAAKIRCYQSIYDDSSKYSPENREYTALKNDYAYMPYTSGSIGCPKAAMIKHAGLPAIILAATAQENLNISKGTRCLQFSSASFDGILMEILSPLSVGGSVYIFKAGINSLAKFCHEYQIERAIFIASLLTALDPEDFPSCFNHVISTGEILQKETAVKWAKALSLRQGALLNGWGPTEATIGVSFGQCLPNDTEIQVGQPVSGMQVFIAKAISENLLQCLPSDTLGEVYIVGDGLAEGYWSQQGKNIEIESLTKMRFKEVTLLAVDGNQAVSKLRVYQTGDQGRINKSGNLEITGRLERAVKKHGIYISVENIEEAAFRICKPFIKLKAVYVTAINYKNGRQPSILMYLFIEPGSIQEIDLEFLYKVMQEEIYSYMLPSHWVLFETNQISRKNNKLDFKTTLNDRPYKINLLSGQVGLSSKEQGSTILEEIAHIWREILGFSRWENADAVTIGDEKAIPLLREVEEQYQFRNDDNFFYLGGTSIQMMSMLERIRMKFKKDILIKEFLKNPTIAGIARRIQKSQCSAEDSPCICLHPREDIRMKQVLKAEKTVPIILIHSLTGNAVADYNKLLDVLKKVNKATIGINAIGLTNPGLMGDTFQETANYYLNELLSHYESNEYILVGWSGGGLFALEMQKQLEQEGKKVSVIMFDTVCPAVLQRSKNKFEKFIKGLFLSELVIARLSGINLEDIKQALSNFEKSSIQNKKSRLHILFKEVKILIKKIKLSDEDEKQKLFVVETMEKTLCSALDYIVEKKIHVQGRVILYAAKDSADVFGSDLSWPDTQKIEIISVPGDHNFVISDDTNWKLLNLSGLLAELEAGLLEKKAMDEESRRAEKILQVIDEESDWKKALKDAYKNLRCIAKKIAEKSIGFIGFPLKIDIENIVIRAEILEPIYSCFSSGQREVVLQGMGGSGKTYLATVFSIIAPGYSIVFWCNASSKETLLASYQILIKELEIPIKGLTPEENIHEANKFLISTKKTCLIIYDDARSASIRDFCPTAEHCNILITSRYKNWGNTIAVASLNEENSIQVVKNILLSGENRVNYVHTENKLWRALVKILGCLPIALNQAAWHIRKTNRSIESYLKAFESKSDELLGILLSHKQNENYLPVLFTFDESLNNIREKAAKENLPLSQLLKVLSFLDETDVPVDLLINIKPFADDLVGRTEDVKKEYLYKAVEILYEYSLIRFGQSNCYGMHSILQTIIRIRLQDELVDINLSSIINGWNAAFNIDRADYSDLTLYVSHGMILKQYYNGVSMLPKNPDEILELTDKLAQYKISYLRDYHASLRLFDGLQLPKIEGTPSVNKLNQAIAIRLTLATAWHYARTEDGKQIAKLIGIKASPLQRAEKRIKLISLNYEKAISFCKESIQICNSGQITLSEAERYDIMKLQFRAIHLLSAIYLHYSEDVARIGDFIRAKELCRSSREIREDCTKFFEALHYAQNLNEELSLAESSNLFFLNDTYRNDAEILWAEGRENLAREYFLKAEGAYDESIANLKKLIASLKNARLITESNLILGYCYNAKGKIHAFLAEKSIDITERNRELSKALEFHLLNHSIEVSIYGESHPESAGTLNRIAKIKFLLGDRSDALKEFGRSRKILSTVWGNKHHDVKELNGKIEKLFYVHSIFNRWKNKTPPPEPLFKKAKKN